MIFRRKRWDVCAADVVYIRTSDDPANPQTEQQLSPRAVELMADGWEPINVTVTSIYWPSQDQFMKDFYREQIWFRKKVKINKA